MSEQSITLISGKHYWYQNKLANHWRISYVGNDADGNQILYIFGVNKPQYISKMDLNQFYWVEAFPPDQSQNIV